MAAKLVVAAVVAAAVAAASASLHLRVSSALVLGAKVAQEAESQ